MDDLGMAGTLNPHASTAAGAHLRLQGDPWQLAAVEPGGALRLLVHDVGAVSRLSELYRFTDSDEAAATLRCAPGTPGRWTSTSAVAGSVRAPGRACSMPPTPPGGPTWSRAGRVC